ncbi:MAG: DUF4160 domain-containing protein [Thermoleophilia bacterium]|nr:DUF4160 domain-containing protein [Thermoleophilia bacterium]
MPRISYFHGITIRMYFNESFHPGRPHFHAFYGGEQASFDVTDLSRLTGKLPLRVERLVRQWARARREDLLENWGRARSGGDIKTIEPLK